MSMTALDPPTDTLALPTPALPAQASLEHALRQRRSCRSFRADGLPLPMLSGLLWAAAGLNRPEAGGRTAPSAHNWQETEVYAVLPEGAYRYDPRAHRLLLASAQDLRRLTGTQDFAAQAPLNLLYVVDFDRMSGAHPDEREFLVGADAACMAQNVYLFCAATGLGTVVRAQIDRRHLALALGLPPTQRIALAQTVGFEAPAQP